LKGGGCERSRGPGQKKRGGEEETEVYGRKNAHRPQLLRNELMTERTTM